MELSPRLLAPVDDEFEVPPGPPPANAMQYEDLTYMLYEDGDYMTYE